MQRVTRADESETESCGTIPLSPGRYYYEGPTKGLAILSELDGTIFVRKLKDVAGTENYQRQANIT
jgi:hypothetical protein